LASNGGSRFTLCKKLHLDRASAPSQNRPVEELENARCLGGKDEKEDVASAFTFSRFSLGRVCNDARSRGRYTEPWESIEKGGLLIGV